jgi:integrase
MAVRRRTWTTQKGERKEAWIVDYADQGGSRHIETFDRKKDADAYHATVKVDVRAGVHTAPSSSPTVAEAGEAWIAYIELEDRERSTVEGYRQQLRRHIVPRIGREKLAQLTTPRVNAFRDDLLASLSRAMAKKVLASLKSILRDAQRRGTVAQNVASSVSIGIDKRNKTRVDIPTPDEIRQIIHAAAGSMWRPLLLTAIFTGLRASELRGLRWQDVDLKRGEVHVRQRADRYNVIGQPKSAAGRRTVPLPPMVTTALREWKLACITSEFVFPRADGGVEHHETIVRGLQAIGVTRGLHSLRHFYASWCINRREDGGLELPAKLVQERLGHSSILMTMDTYGHLFPRGDDGAELAAAERTLMRHERDIGGNS